MPELPQSATPPPSRMTFTAAMVDRTSAPGSFSLTCDSPSARAAQISARWAIDLSDGRRDRPAQSFGAVKAALNGRHAESRPIDLLGGVPSLHLP